MINGLNDEVSFTDIHCHCLPGVDDGPADISESIALCEAIVNDGIRTVAATAHQLGRYSETNESSQIRETVYKLKEELDKREINLSIAPGGDVRIDERICELLDTDKILTIGDSKKYILLELPHDIFVNIEPLIAELCSRGIEPVISHPERHHTLSKLHYDSNNFKNLGIPSQWFEYPIHLQITAGSLLGQFGGQAKTAAWHFLKNGLVSAVATDCHDLDRRRPSMKDAFRIISTQLGRKLAKKVCVDNPNLMIKGLAIESVHQTSTRMCSDEMSPIY